MKTNTLILLMGLLSITVACSPTKGDTHGGTDVNSGSTDVPASGLSLALADSLLAHGNFLIDEAMDARRSSWIRGLRYIEDEQGDSMVQMKTDDKLYIYYQIPRLVWEEWRQSPSLGRYFHRVVKGRYQIH